MILLDASDASELDSSSPEPEPEPDPELLGSGNEDDASPGED